MSLLRLLTTGKSLVGVNDTEGRYRLPRQRLLPQFGPARNPFSNRPNSDPVPVEVGSSGDHGGADVSGDGRGIPILGGKPAEAVQGVVEDRRVPACARGHRLAEALRLRVAALFRRWRARLSRLPGCSSGKAAKPAIPQFTKQAVQEELSLDKIKVMRNDLSDEDLEVVPARQPAAPAIGAPSVRTEERTGVGEAIHERVTTQVFGADKT